MPGGWREDSRDAFTAEGRTAQEQPWYDLIHGLLEVRQSYPDAFRSGLEHFFPKRGVYGFAREQDDARIVTLVNASSEPREVPWANVGPWLEHASGVQELQKDGTLAPVDVQPGTELASWEHRVWVIQK
jgi:glycosidase